MNDTAPSDLIVNRQQLPHRLDGGIAERVAIYKGPEPLYTSGVMAKYAATVSSAADGAITSA